MEHLLDIVCGSPLPTFKVSQIDQLCEFHHSYCDNSRMIWARITTFGVWVPLIETPLWILYGSPWPTFKVTELRGQLWISSYKWFYHDISRRWSIYGSPSILDPLSRDQLCECYHINNINTSTREVDELGSPNLVCRHISYNCHVCPPVCLKSRYHDTLLREWASITKFGVWELSSYLKWPRGI